MSLNRPCLALVARRNERARQMNGKASYETDHVAMADKLWSLLIDMNRSDPSESGARELVWYYCDNTSDGPDKYSPYAHVQAALLYALHHICDTSEEVAQLRFLLADNGESVKANLQRLRDEIRAEIEEVKVARLEDLYGV